MSNANDYSPASTRLGWALAIVYTIHSYVTILMPRSEKLSALREQLRSWHYLLGLILFVLLLWRLWRWFKERPPAPAPGITPAGHAWARQLTVAAYLVLAVMPLLGIVSAWTDGLIVRLGPLLQLPALLHENRTAWMFSGYFHSALSFGVILLMLAAALTGTWFKLRRGTGLIRAFPPGYGAQVWFALGITVYAFSTFKSPEPGPVAVGVFLLATAVIWGIGALLHRNKGRQVSYAEGSAGLRALGAIVCVVLVALAGYLPYANFGVTPWPVGETVAAPADVTSHDAPVVRVEVTPPSAIEAKVRDETFKWCGFCHTFTKNGKHLVGPNLYAIFGQQAGTVPNYAYSPAIAAAGRNGLVWTDETLDEFLADPQKFIPGNRMFMSIGPVKTPEERAAVINLLKKATMEGAY